MSKKHSPISSPEPAQTYLSSFFARHRLVFTSSWYSSLYFSTSACVRCFWKVVCCWISFILSNSHSRSLILSFSWFLREAWWLALMCSSLSWEAACACRRQCTFNHHKEKENSPHLSTACTQGHESRLTQAAVPPHHHQESRQNPGATSRVNNSFHSGQSPNQYYYSKLLMEGHYLCRTWHGEQNSSKILAGCLTSSPHLHTCNFSHVFSDTLPRTRRKTDL